MTKITVLTHNDLQQQDLSLFVDIIYNNFIHLADFPKLLHTKNNIYDTLRDENAVVLLTFQNSNECKKITSFLLGQKIELADRRRVLYINYIYVAETMRHKGLGSELMDTVETMAVNNKLNGVMLIYDTFNPKLSHFYQNRGYMSDLNLRRFDQHDVFYLPV
jgi:GNAT superfamily N-acetyltransferase